MQKGSARVGSARGDATLQVRETQRIRLLHADHQFALWMVVLLAIAAYIPAFWATFVWDDSNIVELPNQVNGLADIWLNPSLLESEGHYWPFTYTTFWLEHKLWGVDPVGYHIVNVLIHAANSLFVLIILRRLVPNIAVLTAVIFAVHPIHVDSVVWAIERKDVLSGLLYFYAAWVYIRSDEREKWGLLYATAILSCALALFSKSIVVTLPVALLLYHWWKVGRITVRNLLTTLPFFVVTAAITIGDLIYYRAREGEAPTYSIFERTQIITSSFWHYFEKLLWPVDMLPLYERPVINGADTIGWLLFASAIAIVLALWILRGRIGRGPLAGFLFFGITLSPNLGIIDYGYMDIAYVADRFAYLASFGLIALAVASGRYLLAILAKFDFKISRSVLTATSVLLIFLLGFQTWNLARNYETAEKFFRYIIDNNPTARGGAYTNLANQLIRQEKFEEAIINYERDLIYNSGSANIYLPYFNLGVANERLDNLEEAEKNYRLSISHNSGYAEAYSNLSNVLVEQNRFEEASQLLDTAFNLDPNEPVILINQARLNELTGEFARAEEILQNALSNQPEDARLLFSYGRFLYEQDRFAEAEQYLRQTLVYDSEHSAAAELLATLLISEGRQNEAQALVANGYLENLDGVSELAELERGNALLNAGDVAGALEAYDSVLASEPENTGALIQRAVALENLDRPTEALASYRQAYELDSDNLSAVYFYALLSARQGLHEQALGLFNEAEELFGDQLVPAPTPGQELPTLVDVYVNRPFALVNLGRLDEALADVERALELAPDNELAAFNREQIQGLISQQEG